jgi:hypothetical protein
LPTYDCAPTLTDTQVLDFCKNGFMMLEAVVPDEIDRRTCAYLDEHDVIEPTEILREDWFHENVICNPAAAGAVRSLLGKSFGLPILMSSHRSVGALPAQQWHRDGGSTHGPEVNYLQVFYYPQECTRAMGPTELLPGSHLRYSTSPMMAHYGSIRGSYHSVAPAGSIFLTMYNIWHRRSAGTLGGVRNLLKYNYFRTAPPTRDWIAEPDFDLATADYRKSGERSGTFDPAHVEMFFWLCGLREHYRTLGGQCWPFTRSFSTLLDKPYGFPTAAEIALASGTQ